jgi:CRP-like cAMP-binding protein
MNPQELAKFDVFRIVLEQFVPLSDDEWAIFRAHLKLATLKKKDFFVQPEEVCNNIALILKGSVRYFHLKDGRQITGFFSVENEMITAYKSFVSRKRASTYIEALEKTELVTLSYNSLQQLMADKVLSFKMERFGRLVAEYLCCCYEDRITSFIVNTPEERYIDLVAKSANIIQRIPQHYIANYLGITPVSLSRIRRRLMTPSEELVRVLN